MAKRKKAISGRQRLGKLVSILQDKKALRPVVLDIRKFSSLYDYFIIASAGTSTQARAMYEALLKEAARIGIKVHYRQDDELARWFLVDFFDVVVHIFVSSAREFYDLEYLWRDAKRINLPLTSKK